jgi:hypothetical protein
MSTPRAQAILRAASYAAIGLLPESFRHLRTLMRDEDKSVQLAAIKQIHTAAGISGHTCSPIIQAIFNIGTVAISPLAADLIGRHLQEALAGQADQIGDIIELEPVQPKDQDPI